jgi:hypothetical protein
MKRTVLFLIGFTAYAALVWVLLTVQGRMLQRRYEQRVGSNVRLTPAVDCAISGVLSDHMIIHYNCGGAVFDRVEGDRDHALHAILTEPNERWSPIHGGVAYVEALPNDGPMRFTCLSGKTGDCVAAK